MIFIFLHLGENTAVYIRDIVGIFDIENTTVDKDTRNFFKRAEDEGEVINVSLEMPKSFIITSTKTKKGYRTTVYISQISPHTLEKRAFRSSQKDFENL